MDRQHTEQDLLTFCRAMANVAASDGRVTEDERDQLEDTILGLGLSPNDPRVLEVLEAEFKAPGSLTDIVNQLSSRDLRAGLLRMLIEVSCADGVLDPAERAKVAEAGAAFGFNAGVVDELVGWTLESIRLEALEKDLMGRLLA